MFAEKNIVGKTIVKVTKGRIVIPTFTGIEKGEKILLIKRLDKKYLYSSVVFDEKVNEVMERKNNSTTPEEKDHYKKIFRAMHLIVQTYEICDSQRRINISRLGFKDGDLVELEGEGKKLIIKNY